MSKFRLEQHPVHLGLGATVVPQPTFTGAMDWYIGYGARHGSDGPEGRLVALHSFDEPWGTWEMHPKGEELVLCLKGQITLHQETADGVVTVTLEEGEAIVNPPGIWHTADVDAPCTVLFITAGEGTENRAR